MIERLDVTLFINTQLILNLKKARISLKIRVNQMIVDSSKFQYNFSLIIPILAVIWWLDFLDTLNGFKTSFERELQLKFLITAVFNSTIK